MRPPHIVGIADCVVSAVKGDCLATYALGSCIAVAMLDPVAGIGGLLHFLLPECSMDAARGRDNLFFYGDTGVRELLNRCLQFGAQKRRLIVHAAGGANVMDEHCLFNIGQKNQASLRKALQQAGLTLDAASLGGHVWRSVLVDIGRGQISVTEDDHSRLAAVVGKSGKIA